MASRIHRMLAPKMITRIVLSGALSLGVLSLYGAGPSPQNPVTVNWQQLQTLNSDVPKAKQAGTVAVQLDNKRIAIPGFMVPLEDDLEMVDEFLLVPYAGACIHVPPPPPNQMIYVKLPKKTPYTSTDPILVTGQLKIDTVVSPYGDVSYDMIGESVKPYQQ